MLKGRKDLIVMGSGGRLRQTELTEHDLGRIFFHRVTMWWGSKDSVAGG